MQIFSAEDKLREYDIEIQVKNSAAYAVIKQN